MGTFRFESMEIWKMAIELCDVLFNIADNLEERKLYRVAEQLRSAVLSISNNIAEGSGSYSKKDFANFLSISKKSSYECLNIIYILNRREIIDIKEKDRLKKKIEYLCRSIHNFREFLLKS